MTLEQAERLKNNDDFQAFMKVIESDAAALTEALVSSSPEEILRTQLKVQMLRSILGRLNFVIEELKPEEVPVSDQPAVPVA